MATVRQFTRSQVLAARLAVRASGLTGRPVPPLVTQVARIRLPEDPPEDEAAHGITPEPARRSRPTAS